MRTEPGQDSSVVKLAALRRKRALIVLGIATAVFTVVIELVDPSHVSGGPTILAFEFAGSSSRAARIVSEWGAKGRSTAHLSLVLDYGYMVSYGLFFCLAGLAILAPKDGARVIQTRAARPVSGWRRRAPRSSSPGRRRAGRVSPSASGAATSARAAS